ncbi:MAG: DUF6577 family protein [Prolixibacteraceae bacterium]
MTIKADIQHINELISELKEKKTFATTDIRAAYRKFEPEIPNSTVNWRIYSLVKEGRMIRIGKGKFIFGTANNYMPEISSQLKSLAKKIKREFPFLNSCIWNTSLLNEFMQHQPGRFLTLVEVEKEAIQSVFYFLKDQQFQAFAEPSEEILEKYLPSNGKTIIIKSLVTEAPVQEIEQFSTTTLEKILVDVFCDNAIFSAQQGAEMRTIYEEAFRKYSINKDRLLRYGQRRNKKQEILKYLETISNNRQ